MTSWFLKQRLLLLCFSSVFSKEKLMLYCLTSCLECKCKYHSFIVWIGWATSNNLKGKWYVYAVHGNVTCECCMNVVNAGSLMECEASKTCSKTEVTLCTVILYCTVAFWDLNTLLPYLLNGCYSSTNV